MYKEYAHIQNTCKDQKIKSLCDENIYDWMFTGIDHAYWSLKNQNGHVICPKCMDEVLKTFQETKE